MISARKPVYSVCHILSILEIRLLLLLLIVEFIIFALLVGLISQQRDINVVTFLLTSLCGEVKFSKSIHLKTSYLKKRSFKWPAYFDL